MTEPAYDFICSIGELMDKLSIENIKCYDGNTRAIAERKKQRPDHVLISELELKVRLAGEQRVRLRNEINRRLAEALKRGEIESAPEVRTYEMRN